MYGEHPLGRPSRIALAEPSPLVRGTHFLTRVNTPPYYVSHSLCAVDESSILLDGDPQTSAN